METIRETFTSLQGIEKDPPQQHAGIRSAPQPNFGTSPGFWLHLELDYELMRAGRENGERISREVQPHAA